MAKQKRREKHVVVDSVKGVHVRVLRGEQRNHMGWVTLDMCACYKCYQENKGTTWGGGCCEVHAW